MNWKAFFVGIVIGLVLAGAFTVKTNFSVNAITAGPLLESDKVEP